MNHGIFRYSLLRYIHSQVLGEVVNVGMLFIFPEQPRVIFKHPVGLHRLKGLYQSFPERLVKAYLRSFAQKSNAISQHWNLFAESSWQTSPDEWIASEFLPRDDSALQFDEVKTSVLYSNDTERVADDFYQSYFADYQAAVPVKVKHDEEYLLNRYKRLLRTKNWEIEKYLKPGITVESDATYLKADLVWQNGTTNLVKSVGLDLADADNINRKSLEYFGRLNLLGKLAEERNYRFDLLVSKPQNRHLLGAYQKALDILRSSSAPKEIVEEREFEQYSEKTAQEMVKQ